MQKTIATEKLASNRMVHPGRRQFLTNLAAAGIVAIGAFSVAHPVQAGDREKAQEIANHFATIKTMTGEFVQFGPRGEQTGGKFYLERPGKVRFDYDRPSPMRVIADGKAVVVGNRKLATWSIYPLSKTPLNLLLGKSINLSGKMLRNIKIEPDLVTIVLGDKSIFGDSTITMMFDPKTNDLRQWAIKDPQGKETTVMIFNVRAGVKFAKNLFKIPYDQVRATKSK